MITDKAAESQASKFINWGYRRTSNTHRMISRIDRPDWYRCMARNHAPWDPNGQGIDWIICMGPACSEDYYRRVYSEDTREQISDKVFKLIPSSNGAITGYCRKRNEPSRYETCKGDITTETVIGTYENCPRPFFNQRSMLGEYNMSNELVEPYDVRDKWKIHSINVVTGRCNSSSNKFYDSFDRALERCKSIVKRDPDVQMVILKCTHVVQAMHPPVEVIDLDKATHSDD